MHLGVPAAGTALAYGALIRSWPIILPNAVTFLLAFPLLVMKLRFRNKKDASAVRIEESESQSA